jgi:hypothetical protein
MTFTIEINAKTIEEATLVVEKGIKRGDFQPFITMENDKGRVVVQADTVKFSSEK